MLRFAQPGQIGQIMNNQVVTKSLTLSRAHHVAARLAELAKTLSQQSMAVIGSTSLRYSPTPDQVEALLARGTTALDNIARARQAYRTVASIRQALGAANAAAGITGLLTQAEGLRGELALLDSLAKVDLLTRVPLATAVVSLKERPPQETALTQSWREPVSNSMPVSLVGLADVDAQLANRAGLVAELNAIGDRINDLNHKVVEIQVPASLAADAGI